MISYYNSHRDTSPDRNITFMELIEEIRSDRHKEVCERIQSAPDKDSADAIKARIPCVTGSGTFTRHAAKCIIEHSGVLIIDIDRKDNPQIEEDSQCADVRRMMQESEHVLFLFSSPSGGIKVGVLIDGDKHLHSFLSAKQWALRNFGIVIDDACKDTSRLCFLSHDKSAYIASGGTALPITENEPDPLPFWKTIKSTISTDGTSPGDDFNIKSNPADILLANGWQTQDGSKWARPGKGKWATSGTLGVTADKQFYCFSSDAAPLEAHNSYNPFALFAAFYHSGDFTAAASQLSSEGYGEQVAENLTESVVLSINALVANALKKTERVEKALEKKVDIPIKSAKPVPQSIYDDAPAIIKDFQRWSEGEAIIPQPFLSIAAALSLMSVTCGRKYSFRGQRSNLFIVVSAPSSAGKENGRKALKKALSRPCAIDMLGSGSVASDTAILRTLEEKKRVLFPFDEVGHMIANNKAAKGAAHLANIAPTLMELYSSAGSVWPGRAYADKENNIPPIEDPHLCIYGTTTPIMVKQAFTSEDAQTGFTGRVLFFQSFDEPAPRVAPNCEDFPNSVRDYIEFACAKDPKAMSGNLAFLNNSTDKPKTTELRIDEDAAEIMRSFQLRMHAQKVSTSCDSIKGIIGKAYEICMRVSICAAVAENYRNPRITMASARWSIDLVEYLTSECLVMAENNMHNTKLDDECDRLLTEIGNHAGGISRRELMRSVRGIGDRGSASDYGKVLAELETRELIKLEKLGRKELYSTA
jgi:hypothetical protein